MCPPTRSSPHNPLALSVSDLTVSTDGKYVYASRNGVRGADVAVLDTTTDRVEVIDIATTPGTTTECVRISSDGGLLYVGINGPSGGQLVVIATRAQSDDDAGSAGHSRWRRKNVKSSNRFRGKDVQTGPRVVGTIEIGSSVRDVALSRDGATAYVASCGPDFGAVVDTIDTRTNKITSTRKIGEIGGLVTRLTLSGNGDRAYLVSEDRLTVLCTLTQDVIGTVMVDQPSCAVESSYGNYLYIADYSGTVTMTPVASTMSALEQAALESNRSVDWIMPELLQYEAVLA
jgi:DNA-binding beta-propeller fold protein YncE